jgi:hypothetical protein
MLGILGKLVPDGPVEPPDGCGAPDLLESELDPDEPEPEEPEPDELLEELEELGSGIGLTSCEFSVCQCQLNAWLNRRGRDSPICTAVNASSSNMSAASYRPAAEPGHQAIELHDSRVVHCMRNNCENMALISLAQKGPNMICH